MHGFKAKRIKVLDGLRGLAILMVLAHHQLIPVRVTGGFLGVDLFFVLSGFLITTLLVEEFDATGAISLKRFYARRALRLGPALLLYLLVSLTVILRTNPTSFVAELKSAGWALSYMANWQMAFSSNPPLGPTAIIWSLSIEEQFYLLWPPLLFVSLLFNAKRSQLIVGLTILIIFIMAHRYLLWSNAVDLHRMYYGTDTRADAPLIGCVIALIPFTVSARPWLGIIKGVGLVAAVIFASLVCTLDFSDRFLYRGGYTVVALLAAIVIWTSSNVSLHIFSAVLEWYPLRWLGKISYGLYLWHWLLLKTTSFYEWFGTWDPWVRLVVAIGVAAACFYLIERPFNNLKNRFGYDLTLANRSSKSKELQAAPIMVPRSTLHQTPVGDVIGVKS